MSQHVLTEPRARAWELHSGTPGLRNGRASRESQHPFTVAAAEAQPARPGDADSDRRDHVPRHGEPSWRALRAFG